MYQFSHVSCLLLLYECFLVLSQNQSDITVHVIHLSLYNIYSSNGFNSKKITWTYSNNIKWTVDILQQFLSCYTNHDTNVWSDWLNTAEHWTVNTVNLFPTNSFIAVLTIRYGVQCMTIKRSKMHVFMYIKYGVKLDNMSNTLK